MTDQPTDDHHDDETVPVVGGGVPDTEPDVLGDTGGPAQEAAADTEVDEPVAAEAASPVVPPADEVPRYVAAARSRKRIPLWVVPIFPALIVWAIIYVNAVQKPPAGAADPLTMGGQLYATHCAGCHGPTGGGGVGPAFTGKALDKVFPDYREQLAWVDIGSAAWPRDTFGADKKPPARSGATMPGFGPQGSKVLTCDEIALVVRYEREALGGGQAVPELVTATEQIAAAGASGTGDTVDCSLPAS